MPPPAKKRKITPPPEEENPHHQDNTEQGSTDSIPNSNGNGTVDNEVEERSTAETSSTTKSDVNTDRLARFAALKARATQSSRSNLDEAKAEAKRAAIDPTVLSNLSRRSAIAQHNLLKADTEEEGGAGAFERKRAWDYTIEESERWDERLERKKLARENNSFADYSAEAAKVYDRQIRDLEKQANKNGSNLNREDYERQKAELIQQAARAGGLEIVEMENGELVAIDKEGKFYADQDNIGFVEQKPRKENVDRLVQDIKKADDIRMKKRRERGLKSDEGGDVTYINEKNKQFNMKLARFYDRYTADIRESFERGTAI